VADDNTDMRAYVSRVLSAEYEVEEVPDGRAALAAALARPPDLVLTDVMMPQLDGLGLLRELRAHEATRAIPVVVLSARAGAGFAVEGLDAGADDYLSKPFAAPELLARVRSTIELFRTRRRIVERETRAGELERAVHLRDDFLEVAAHELRTPIAATVLALGNLARACPDEISRDRAERAAAQVRRLHALTETILDVGQLTTGRLLLRRERIDVVDTVAEVIEHMEENAARHGTRVVFARDEGVPGTFDKVRIAQIVTNLLDNALKFGAGRPVEVSVRRAEGRVRIAVVDHGPGIAPQDRERVFGKFERGVPTRHHAGFGLGLWITRELVQAQGGVVRAEETPGGGATFAVELPAEG
jgi:signal transduction histidine kinase